MWAILQNDRRQVRRLMKGADRFAVCSPGGGLTALQIAAAWGRSEIVWDLLLMECAQTSDDGERFPRDLCCGAPEWLGKRASGYDPEYGMVVCVDGLAKCAEHFDEE